MKLRTFALFLPTLAFACGGEDDPGYDRAALSSYRQAIPDESRLVTDVPTADPQPGALTAGADAVLAREGVKFARAVNQPARLMVRALRAVVDLPPTFFDSEKKQFVWGPWQNDEGIGDVFVYIQENADGEDFRYSYALARTINGDLATATPVIWGAATPDAEDDDKGVGVTLWDLEANRAFELGHDMTPPELGRGRFVMLYGHQAAEGREAFFNVAVFRNFVPGDNPAQEPADIDYFYGRFLDGSNAVDFVDTAVTADICDAPTDAADPSSSACFDDDAVSDQDEAFRFVTLFVNGGLGRAEATVSGGDVEADLSMIECWNRSLDRTFLHVASGSSSVESGACLAPTDQPMSALGLPSLDSLDPALVEKLSCAAEHGALGCP
jgi:hypothetical protein